MNAKERRKALEKYARMIGYSLIKCDFRLGFAHIRKGVEVRQVAVHRSMSEAELLASVNRGAVYGERLDQRKTSTYYAGEPVCTCPKIGERFNPARHSGTCPKH